MPRPDIELVDAARAPAGDVARLLETSERGLTASEAARRLASDGPNAIRTHGAQPFEILLRQLRNPLLILLAGATLVSLFVGEKTDALIITAIVALSVGLGFFNEYRSEKVVEALHASIRHRTTVLRDGESATIDVTDVVVGDVILLRTGDLVPADLRLTEVRELECDEAVLTGEAMPKSKSADPATESGLTELGLRQVAYMGTVVRGGAGRGVVVRAGGRTAFGRIALRLGERQPQTAFQRGLGDFSMLLVRVTVVLTGAIFVGNALLGRPLLESALFSLAIAVGLTPQLLPAIVTISLATGARALARKRVVVKRLISIEDLGNVEVLFTDKTGTLTEGRITLRDAVDPGGARSEAVLRLGLASVMRPEGEGADVDASAGPLDDALRAGGPVPAGVRVVDELPFDHERRMASVVIDDGDGHAAARRLVTKGAPESILARCRSVPVEAQPTVDRAFAAGARVVAIATRPWTETHELALADEHDLELAGFVTFDDRPKADAKEALAQLAALGVEVKVITGDNGAVAETVCGALGLRYGETVTGRELETMSDEDLAARLPRIGIFARVSPEQKSRVIGAQRKLGKDVGYLGDGVNDAVALHDADVGIAVEGGSEVAKDAADIVLLDKDLGILAGGVLEGRRIFANTMKYVLMGTSSNFGNMFSAAGGSLLLEFLPMTPTQILLNNLLYDTGEMTIPTDTVDGELLERPSQWDVRLIRRFMIFFGPISSVFDFLTFGVMLFVFHSQGSVFQTAWFTESLATQSLVIFAIRTRRVPFFTSVPGRALTLATLATIAVALVLPFTPLGALFGFTPLPPAFLAILLVMVVVYLTLVEIGKSFFFGPVLRRARTGTPIDRWRTPEPLARIEKLATRWSVRDR